jgi:clan AA aspartic protease (TIGR02281 family)
MPLLVYLAEWLMTVEWSSIALGAIAVLYMWSKEPHADRMIVIPADAGNACHADLTVNKHVFRHMLLDTGATGMPLVFGSNHAAALGFDQSSLAYSHIYTSANGQGREASVQLHDVSLNGWSLGGVAAVVTKATQDDGLIGAELLHALNFRTVKGYCVLTMPEQVAGRSPGQAPTDD